MKQSLCQQQGFLAEGETLLRRYCRFIGVL